MEVNALVDAAVAAPAGVRRALLEALLREVGPAHGRELLQSSGVLANPGAGAAPAVPPAAEMEGLARPLLRTLQQLTGMSSTYLTCVDAARDEQQVLLSLNLEDGSLSVPEGVRVTWGDTLCKRALEEGRPCTTDVAGIWGDAHAAQELGIRSYVSVPVRLADGRLWGTLCGADQRVVEGAEDQLPTMQLFAQLIAGEVERSAALADARHTAETDALTGCATRRAVESWLGRARDTADDVVAAVFVDLDAFKQVNDTYGHAAGDAALAAVGAELRSRSRTDDLVGRVGGDEFVVAAALRSCDVPGFVDRWDSPIEVRLPGPGDGVTVRATTGVAVVPAPRVGELLAEADQAMYASRARVRG